MMKKYGKRFLAAALAGAMALACTACGGSGTSGISGSAGTAEGSKKIGVIQFTTVPSLDNCYKGFLKGLQDEGFVKDKNLTIDFQNAQAETATADTQAQTMANKKYDLLGAIATPAAMSAYSAAKSNDIPVVFTAVSDPVSAKLVKSLDHPGSVATGSSDQLPLEAQVKMIRAFLPKAKKIGVLYTTSEPNSVSTLERLKKIAPKYNFEVVGQGVTNDSEVASGAQVLVAKGVDCFNNFTDNNVVNNMKSELQAANKAGIPVFGSEEEQVRGGCLGSVSIDFTALGEETGKIAGKILKGEAKPQDTKVYTTQTGTPIYNTDVLTKLKLTVPAAYKDAAKTTTTKSA
ncbi:ABC transporter substrate-binding protein [Caproicibacterium sp. XB2]|jgi:putative ABC transport system substrate-binding protein|uniref:ABC transporter substrate-binding protein n=1 Tax=Caproicibacterium sp. XB2 TaxID=3388458 RepID=UPI003850113E